MDPDGVRIEHAAPDGDVAGMNAEALAGEYASLLLQARSLAAELEWGSAKSFSVRGLGAQVVFAFGPKDLFLGVEAGPAGLGGQIRYLLRRALVHMGDP